MKRFFVRYRYELITAISGGVVMIVELVGARMLAPYVGSSLYVWTTMIGVILGALSFGYWYGGKLADRKPNDDKLMKIVSLAAFFILVTMLIHTTVLSVTVRLSTDVRVVSLVAAILLFAPAALLLGIVSPYVARLRLRSLDTAGESIGRLYAAGTFGSIVGTFLAGYWLISWFGNQTLGSLVVLVLLALSFFIAHRHWVLLRVVWVAATLIALTASSPIASQVIADIDTPYNRYLITETDKEPQLRALVTDPFSTQSQQFVDQPDVLVAQYTQQFMAISESLRPNDILVVGGGAYTFPLAFSRANPDSTVTVVEIDEKLTEISERYFGLQDRQNLVINHQDGRVFLNQAVGTYNVIYMDAFSSLTPPYQLTTIETVRHEKRLLRENGVVVTNAIASVEDDAYLSAVIGTQRAVFRYVDAYRVVKGIDADQQQNVLIVATDSLATRKSVEATLGPNQLISSVQSGRVLTDDHAPVEQLINSR